MSSEKSFIKNAINAFINTHREIEKGASEHDVRYKFVKYFLEGVLGHSSKFINWEKKRADLTINDENGFAIVKIETKRPTESVEKDHHIEQAFKYLEGTTKFIGLTNFLKFKLWEVEKDKRKLRIDLDFEDIINEKKFSEEKLNLNEKNSLLFFTNITKEAIFDPKKYEKFDENYAKVDITTKIGFNKLIERLNFIVNELLLGFTLRSFGEYKEGYRQYSNEMSKLDNDIKSNGSKELRFKLMKLKEDLKSKYERYLPFYGFELWKKYSGREDQSDEEVREIFCKETIYVLLNKLIFIRICEDKNLVEKSISNGGIEQLRDFIKKRVDEDNINKEILEFAFKSASSIYAHFYEPGILDWYKTGDGELDKKLNRVLWLLNQFNFTYVDRDILGNLYERYLPKDERKKLGEFYTPTEVIDYILTAVNYTYNNEIREKDILDPACGSGGFLVRATRRLISKYLITFSKSNKNELKDPKNWKEILSRLSVEESKIILEAIQERIYGLDINPFACHIAEMNLLFQIVDLYQKIKESDKKYKLKRFKIYRTNSLEPEKVQKNVWEFQGDYVKSLAKDQEEVDSVKKKKFDFVVGNPPYVRKEKIPKLEKEHFNKYYNSIYHGDNDLCVYFLYRGVEWMKDDGNFGYIISSKFTKTRYGKYIRAFIPENTRISEFIDLRGSKVFANVTVDPVILILDKKKSDNIRVVNVKNDFEESTWDANLRKLIYHIYLHKGKNYQDKYINSFTVNQNTILKQIKDGDGKRVSEEWKLINEDELKVFEKIKQNSNCLLKDIADVYSGIKTGRDNIYRVDPEQIKKYKLEKSILRPVIDGKDIKKYKINRRDLFLIFPENINLSDYPNTKDYLSNFKDELSKRTDIIKTNKKWYEFRSCNYYNIFDLDKIVVPDISTKNNFALDNKKSLCTMTCFEIIPNKIDIFYLLGIFNSKLMEFYFKKISSFLGKEGYRYKKVYLDILPFIIPKTQEQKQIAKEIISRVNKIIDINKTKQELDHINPMDLIKGIKTKKLSTLAIFSISDNTKFKALKIEGNKLYITLKDYIEIKDKFIFDYVYHHLKLINEELKKSNKIKEILLNIEVPSDKNKIREILKKLNKELGSDKDIMKLEKVIDLLVCDLYGLTKKEIQIVDDGFR